MWDASSHPVILFSIIYDAKIIPFTACCNVCPPEFDFKRMYFDMRQTG